MGKTGCAEGQAEGEKRGLGIRELEKGVLDQKCLTAGGSHRSLERVYVCACKILCCDCLMDVFSLRTALMALRIDGS